MSERDRLPLPCFSRPSMKCMDTQNEHGRYTHGHEAAVLASHAKRTAYNSAAYLLPVLQPGMSLLDVGFGPGTITLDFAELVAPGTVVGIENTDGPFAAARANAAQRGDHQTRFEKANVFDMPYPDASFDVVHAHQVLQHLTDPVQALREMTRVCKSGGWIAARDADYAAMMWYPDIAGLSQWRDLYRALARHNGAEPDAGRHMRAWAHASGLTDVRVTTSEWCYADSEACAWWGESQAARVLGDGFMSQAAEHGYDSAAVESLAADWRSWGHHADAYFLIPHVEILAQKAEVPS